MVCVGPTKIFIQDLQLLHDLFVGDVLSFVGIYHVENNRNGHDDGLELSSVGTCRLPGLDKLCRVRLKVIVPFGIGRVHAHHLDMFLVCCTLTVHRSFGGFGLTGSVKRAHEQGEEDG